MIRSIPLSLLIEDFAIYPRHDVDSQHIANLVLALDAGAALPAPVVDGKTMRIVDGVHRVRAYRRVLGDQASIDCDVREYPDESALVFDAIHLNAQHGRKLDRIDQVRIIHLAESVGLAPQKIALALQVPPERVERLKVRVAIVPAAAGTKGAVLPLKRGAAWLAGQTLTPAQVQAHASLPGTSLLLTARQLRDALRAGLVNVADDGLMVMLCELQTELTRVCGKKKP